MTKLKNQTVLITGASGGIGLELAKIFAQNGYHLVLVARREEKLNELKSTLETQHGIEAKVIAKDLSQPTAPQEICDELQNNSIHVDILVNNAGFASYGSFSETGLDTELQMLQVNITALTHLTHLFLPPMLARKRGRILNVASIAAFQPGPLMAVYYASKAYVLSFSEAIEEELRNTGITVTCLCPGATQSGFQSRAKMENSKLMQGELTDAATIAHAGYRALMRGQSVMIPGWREQLWALTPRFLPRWLTPIIVRKIQETKD